MVNESFCVERAQELQTWGHWIVKIRKLNGTHTNMKIVISTSLSLPYQQVHP